MKYREYIVNLNNAKKISERIKDEVKKEEIIQSLMNREDSINLLIIEDKIAEGDLLKTQNESKNAIQGYKSCFSIVKMLNDPDKQREIKRKITDSIHLVKIDDKIKEGDLLRREKRFKNAIQK